MYTFLRLLSFIVVLFFNYKIFAYDYTKEIVDAFKKNDFVNAIKYSKLHGNRELTKIITIQKYLHPSHINFYSLKRFILNNPEFPLIKNLKIRAESLLSNEPKDEIIKWFKKNPPITGVGYKNYGFAASNIQEDVILKNCIIKKGWWYGDFDINEQNKYLNLYFGHLTNNDHVKRIHHILWQSNWADNLHLIKPLISKLSKIEQKIITLRILSLKKNDNAYKLFKKLPQVQQLTPGLLYDQLVLQGKKEINKHLMHLLLNFNSDEGYESKFIKWRILYARELLKIHKYKEAYKIIKNHADKSNSVDTCEAEWLAGWIALRHLHNYDIAETHFKNFYKKTTKSISRSKAEYWLGSTYYAKEDFRKAKIWFSRAANSGYTFYGQMAAIALNLQHIIIPTQKYNNQNVTQTLSIKDKNLFDAILLLAKHDHVNLFEVHLKEAITNIIGKTQAIEELLSQYEKNTSNRYFYVHFAKQLSYKGIVLTKYAYPTPYNLKNMYVDAPFIYAVIRQESSFNEKAYDPRANDAGLMQIIPSTAENIAKSLKVKCDLKKLISDPYYNIKFGSYHLKERMDYYNNSIILSIASYNAGIHNTDRWIKNYGDPRKMKHIHDIIDWTELISFPDTRNHVQRILENLAVYKFILNNATVDDIIRDMKQ